MTEFEVVSDDSSARSLGYWGNYETAVYVALRELEGERFTVWQVADDAGRTRVCAWANLTGARRSA